MRTWRQVVAVALLSQILGAYGQQEQRTAILPAREAKMIPGMFLRKMTGKITGTWQPTPADFASLEANLAQISAMQIPGWPAVIHIEHPEKCFRQYIAVIRDGQEEIFVSAFCDDDPPAYWHERLVITIDGDVHIWRAFYNPATKTFSDLDINARA